MASTRTESLEQEFAQLEASYDSGFAGKSRATRDLGELDGLIKRLRELIPKIEANDGAAPSKLLENARARLATCETERQAIQAAKAGGPDAIEFSRLAAFANFVFARYHRHFAGQSRDSRDLGLLKEMVDELRTIRQRMKAIASSHPQSNYKQDSELVAKRVEQYEQELREVEKAHATGTPEELGGKLANLANLQFELYSTHFLGQSRLTRRPALLQRVIENLRRIRGAMKNVRIGGQGGENNRGNLGVVDEALRHYETELAEIRKVRQAAPMVDIMGMLGSTANEVFEEYRQKYSGKDRRAVNQQALSVLCDKLGEVARQMSDMSRTEQSEMNETNLDIVIEQLGMYEDEWRAIEQLKSTPKA
jgi:hypothetical protein